MGDREFLKRGVYGLCKQGNGLGLRPSKHVALACYLPMAFKRQFMFSNLQGVKSSQGHLISF